tara:strand:+ start:285 stop:1760 length:1476 start_codon:yes stop_codon:yes gene_type:complete
MPRHDRIRLIDPASYQGPSAFEGLDSLLNTINNIQRQEEAIERADRIREQDLALKEEERNYQRDQDALANKIFMEDRENQAKAQQTAENRIGFNTILENYKDDSQGAMLALKERSSDFKDLPEYAATLKSLDEVFSKNQTHQKVIDTLGLDPKDYTLEEAKDVKSRLLTQNASPNIIRQIDGIINQKNVFNEQILSGAQFNNQVLRIKSNPENVVERDENSIKNLQIGTQDEIMGRVLNDKGEAALKRLRQQFLSTGESEAIEPPEFKELRDAGFNVDVKDGVARAINFPTGETKIGTIESSIELIPGFDQPFKFQDPQQTVSFVDAVENVEDLQAFFERDSAELQNVDIDTRDEESPLDDVEDVETDEKLQSLKKQLDTLGEKSKKDLDEQVRDLTQKIRVATAERNPQKRDRLAKELRDAQKQITTLRSKPRIQEQYDRRLKRLKKQNLDEQVRDLTQQINVAIAKNNIQERDRLVEELKGIRKQRAGL